MEIKVNEPRIKTGISNDINFETKCVLFIYFIYNKILTVFILIWLFNFYCTLVEKLFENGSKIIHLKAILILNPDRRVNTYNK